MKSCSLSATRFVRYLTENIFWIFWIIGLQNWSRDHRIHGNVGNRCADRMAALSNSCGTVFRSKWPSEEQKSRFWSLRHLFPEFGEIWKMSEPKKMLAIWSRVFLSEWKRFGVNRWPGGRAMRGNVLIPRENPGCARFSSLDIPFSNLCFLDCRDLGFAPRNEERWPWVTERP